MHRTQGNRAAGSSGDFHNWPINAMQADDWLYLFRVFYNSNIAILSKGLKIICIILEAKKTTKPWGSGRFRPRFGYHPFTLGLYRLPRFIVRVLTINRQWATGKQKLKKCILPFCRNCPIYYRNNDSPSKWLSEIVRLWEHAIAYNQIF